MKTVAPLILSLVLIGCSDHERFKESRDASCRERRIGGEYIVHWHDKPATLLKHHDIQAWSRDNSQSIKFVEPNYATIRTETLPWPRSDTSGPESLRAMIDSSYAWSRRALGQNIVVAVIDSGVAIHHPLLKDHILINKKEYGDDGLPNGRDDDGNGYIDDIHGWNFVSNSPDVTDELGHGTAVAGIISGLFRNGASLSLAPEAKILPVDFMNEGTGTEYHARQAIDYALQRRVHIVNNSWSTACSELLLESFQEWRDQDVIFVNAAGNIRLDVVANGIIPPSLGFPNLLNVGSIGREGQMSTFSGYGNTVRIYAPGENVPILYQFSGWNRHATSSGTSLSAAIVSGSAALLWSAYPDLKATDVIKRLIEGSERREGLRIINLRRAFQRTALLRSFQLHSMESSGGGTTSPPP